MWPGVLFATVRCGGVRDTPLKGAEMREGECAWAANSRSRILEPAESCAIAVAIDGLHVW